MKLLAISHSCVTDVNQQLYLELQKTHGIEMEVIVPATWKSSFTGERHLPGHLVGMLGLLRRLPVYLDGHVSLHFYRHGLRAVIATSNPDVVFVDEEPWSLAAFQAMNACRSLKIPFLCYTKQNINKRYPPPFRWIEKSIYSTANAIVALSEEVEQVLRAKGFTGSAPILAHGCDLSLFYPGQNEPLRQSLGLSGLVIGYMGRLAPEKGIDTLIQAVAQLKASRPVIRMSVLIVGSGPETERLANQIKSANLSSQVVCAGAIPHTAAGDYLRCMDAMVLPSRTTKSWKEQFGRVIVESLACEVPVIGSSSGYIPQLIRGTRGGLVFREGDAADLQAKIELIADNETVRQAAGKNGREAVLCSYTYAAVASKLFTILQGVVKQS